jgi:WD40 repeat protein
MSPGVDRRDADHASVDQHVDLFISYSPRDERWASWLGWRLELAGYRTLLAAWDLVPGSTTGGFTERAIRRAAVTLAVLSHGYLTSRRGSPERHLVLRTDPARLVTVQVEECPADLVPTSATHLDLAHVPDGRTAEAMLLARLRDVLVAIPSAPASRDRVGHLPAGPVAAPRLDAAWLRTSHPSRRIPAVAPRYPPEERAERDRATGLSLLHVAGPRFGRGLVGPDDPITARDARDRVLANVTRLTDTGVPAPDLIVVSGDLTESARPRQFEEAWTFLTGLRVALALEPHRLIVVPGGRDVSKAACEAYFNACEARDLVPSAPYYPKLELYAEFFADLYHGLDEPLFDGAQPWTLFTVPELRVAVAALNSTMAMSHRPQDNYGLIGDAQAAWFAERLRPFLESEWLRIGVVRHDPLPGSLGAEDPATLRDTDTLATLLGRRLNLLLHGPGPGPTKIEWLGPEGPRLPVFPAAAAGRDEILHLTEDGVRRFVPAYGQPDARDEQRVSWHRASATFTPSNQDRDAPRRPVLPARGAVHDPHTLLLQRIADVCAARWPNAEIRQLAGEPPQLLVTRQEQGFTVQQRIGAHAGQVSTAVVDAFLRHDQTEGAELVYQGPPPPDPVRRHATRRHTRLRSFTEFQGLLDLADYVDRQTARLRADPVYPPELYVPQRFRELGRGDQTIREDLARYLVELVTEDEGQFVLVLGDFGRGKSFALREVARRIAESGRQLVPMLIDLAALDRSLSVDGLVAAHLAQHGEHHIDLAAFRYMLGEGRIVLLFDGFDELVTRVSYESAADHLETLLRVADGKTKIITASRTQHFKSHEQVFRAMGERVGTLTQRRILTVEEFTAAQIRQYLVNRYRGDQQTADHRFQLLSAIGDLLGLAQNPRMLSFIADLDEERISAAARHRHTISPAALYQEFLRSWMAHERRRAEGGPGAAPALDTESIWSALTTLALRLWEAGETYARPAELAEVAETLTGLAAARLSPHQRVHAVGSGSLLVRTEEGLFGFIHPSVMEWLVANAIAAELDTGSTAPAQLSHRPFSQLTVDFLCDIADTGACQAYAEHILADPDADPIARTNASKIQSRLSMPATADLRGAVLRGHDLSYRDLGDVDLTGADLTEANLVGANLSGADLRDAHLVGARLDHAKLVGADLSGTDLRRARLSRADLTGVIVSDRTNWTRAALIDVIGLPDSPGLRAAAVAPGSPVDTEFAPSSMGVRRGVDPARDGLPHVVAYSPDGDTLAIGSDDGGVVICDAVSGRSIRTLQGHRDQVNAVAYRGGVLVTAGWDGTVRIWDATTGRAGYVLEGHTGRPWPVLVDPAGELVITGDREGTLRLWDVPSGSVRRRIPSPGGAVVSMALHGTRLATAYRGAGLRFWDTATGAAMGSLPGSYHRVVFSAAGDLLFCGTGGGELSAWDPSTGRLVDQMHDHTGAIHALAPHPNEQVLAAGDTDGKLWVWNIATGQRRQLLGEHETSIYCVAFSPSGDTLASGDRAGLVRIWDTATGALRRELTAHTGSIWPFAFHPDGSPLAVSDDQGETRLWDLDTGRCQHMMSGHGRHVYTVRFSADGELLATSGNDGAVRLWNPANGSQLRLIGSGDRLVNLETAVFSPVRRLLATVGDDGRLNLLNLKTDRYERHLYVESAPIWAVAFDSSGDHVATANDDDTVRVWHYATGQLVHTLAEHRGRVRSIAYSPDGALIATGCDDSNVRLWDAGSGTLVRTLAGHTDRVYAVRFGRGMLASASWDSTARVWELESGRTRHLLDRHIGRLWSVAVNPSGRLVATGGDDLVIRLWDSVSGDHLQTLVGHNHRVWSLAFNPAGDLLASGSDDGTARLWSVSGDHARQRLALLGLPRGWAAVAPSGRYKVDGVAEGQFWHVIGTCRFDIGELDGLLAEIRQVPTTAQL